jgi:hypothetical protein
MAIPSDQKNIWVAAGDGDLARVRDLVEQHHLSPNAPDQFTYTPMYHSPPSLPFCCSAVLTLL